METRRLRCSPIPRNGRAAPVRSMKNLIARCREDYQTRTIVATRATFFLNAASAVIKLTMSIFLLSPWFAVNAVYYIALCLAKGRILKRYQTAESIGRHAGRYDYEFTVYKRTGVLICALGAIYMLVCLRMFFAGEYTAYSGNTVYLIALIGFVKMGLAIHGTIAARHLKTPIISAIKAITFIDALVSIVVTQCTLLSMQNADNPTGYSAVTGMVFSAAFIILGIVMLTKKKEQNEGKLFSRLQQENATNI